VEGENPVQNPDGRREMLPESTWNGFRTLSSDLLDLLIVQCDEDNIPDSCSDQWPPAVYNPFSAFRLKTRHDSEALTDLETDTYPELQMEFATELQVMLNAEHKTDHHNQISLALEAFPGRTPTERMLFHHYVSHVAIIMMPYEHARNPWKRHYPVVAHGRTFPDQTALYHAMLAQAAFNISELRAGDAVMMAAGSRHYEAAIQQLVSILGGKEKEFGSLLASIMTLIFAETYSGESRKWRHHFRGAWTLFEQYRASEPWKVTDFVCVSIQSLNIIKVISETSDVVEPNHNSNCRTIQGNNLALDLVSSTLDFGFTIGTSAAILDCISRITDFRKVGSSLGDPSTSEFLQEILARLNTCLRDELASFGQISTERQNGIGDASTFEHQSFHSQRVSFVYATYIYLYRAVLNVPPQTIQDYVSKIFENVSFFSACSHGNFSIWPAFIAAVEAATDDNIALAREWLIWATSFGLGNRPSMRRVIEHVWATRETLATNYDVSRGLIAIDWRDIMVELDCDVLLV
jgi:hypothetical protein